MWPAAAGGEPSRPPASGGARARPSHLHSLTEQILAQASRTPFATLWSGASPARPGLGLGRLMTS